MSELANQTPAAVEATPSAANPNLDASAEKLVQELPKVEAAPEKKEEMDYSSRFAALSRREKQLVERERRLKDIESKNKTLESTVQTWETKKQEFKKNPDLIFEEIGMSFDDLVNFKLGIKEEAEKKDLDPNELYKKIKQDLEAELENKLKAREDEALKLQQEAEQKQNAQVIENYRKEIVDTIRSQNDKYELINYQGNYDLVFDVIEQYYNEHEELLPLDQAADHVEQYLEGLVDGATKLKKFQSKLAPKVVTQPEEAGKTEPAIDSKPKTLSNSLNSSSPSSSSASIDPEESKRRASALLRWN